MSSNEYCFECYYCGHKWTTSYWLEPDVNAIKCEKCDDCNLRVKVNEKIDYYK